MLYVVHYRPETHFFTGKWIVRDRGVDSYIEIDAVQYPVSLTKNALNYMYSRIIDDSNIVGTYVPKELSIVYLVEDISGISLSSRLKDQKIVGDIISKNIWSPVKKEL